MDANSGVGPIITRDTRTTLGVVFSVVIVLLGAFGYMESWKSDQRCRFDALETALDKQDRRMEALEQTVQRVTHGRWTEADMRLWAVKLAAANANLNLSIPEPR